MKLVLDASVFFVDLPLDEPAYTTPSVVGELVDLCAKCRYEALLATGLSVQPPTTESIDRVNEAARKTGDAPVLSAADREIIGLALDLAATLVTDDYAVQNVAHELGVPVPADTDAQGACGRLAVPVQRVRSLLPAYRDMQGLRCRD